MKEDVYSRLAEQPEGVSEVDLIDILFPGDATPNPFSRMFLRRLLAGDPRVESCGEDRWRLATHHLFSLPIAEVPFVVVDLEATGDSDAGSSNVGVTEIGAVRFRGRREEGRFERLVDPGSRIPPYVEKLTGITNEMVEGAPRLEEVIGAFYDFARGAVLVAHNAAFDYAVLDRTVWRVLRRPLDCPALCTIDLVRHAFPDLERTSLDWLADHFEIERPTRHRAVADADLTGKVLYRCLAELAERGLRTLGDLTVEAGDPLASTRLRMGISQSRLESLPQGAGVFRLIDATGATLFVGRAEDVRERVVQLYLSADRLGSRQLEMMQRTRDVDAVAVGSHIEGLLEEAAQIRLCDPPFNRGAKHVPKLFFVKVVLADPRTRVLAASRVAADGALYLGPLRSRELAEQAVQTLAAAFEVELGAPAIGSRAHTGSRPANRPEPCDPGGRELVRVLESGPNALNEAVEARLGDARGASRGLTRLLRRLGRVDRDWDWLVHRHDYLAVLPPASGPGRTVVVVQAGCFRAMLRVVRREDTSRIRALLVPAPGAGGGRRSRAARADAASIMLAWLRSSRGRDGACVLRLRDRNDESTVDTAIARLEAMLDD